MRRKLKLVIDTFMPSYIRYFHSESPVHFFVVNGVVLNLYYYHYNLCIVNYKPLSTYLRYILLRKKTKVFFNQYACYK